MATRIVSELRRLDPAVARYFVSIAMVGFAIDGGVYAVLLNLFLVRMGYGTEQIGLVNAAGTLTFALASLPAGALGSRWGSRRALLLGLVLMLVGYGLLPLADLLAPSWRLVWLVATEVVAYTGLALYFVNTAPYVIELVSIAQRNRVISLQTGLLSLSAFLGSLVGGLLPPLLVVLGSGSLEQPAPYRYALIVAGLSLLPAIVVFRATRPAPTPPVVAMPANMAAPPAAHLVAAPIAALLIMLGLVRMLQVSGLAATTTFFNVYLDTELLVPTAQIGALIAAGRLLGVPAALATSALTARFGNRAVVIAATLGTAVSILPIAFVPHWAVAGLGFVGVVGFSWIRYASSLVYFLELVPPSRRSTVSGVMEMSAGVCFTAITLGGGYAIALLGYRSLFLTGAVLTGVSALVFWLFFRNRA
jgi:MFS family permease